MASSDNPLLILVRAHGFTSVHGFAKSTGVSPDIRGYFSRGRRPNANAIAQIAKGLGVAPEYVAKELGFNPYETA